MTLLLATVLFAAWGVLFVSAGLAIRCSAGPRLLQSDFFQSALTCTSAGVWTMASILALRELTRAPLEAQMLEIVGAAVILAIMVVALFLLHPLRKLRDREATTAAGKADVLPFSPTPATPTDSGSPARRAA